MKSSAAVIASKAKMEQRLEYVKAELAVAREREVFHEWYRDWETPNIFKIGRAHV